MTASPSKIIELRTLLAEKYPSGLRPAAAVLETGLPALDALLGGGLRRGALVEIARRQPAMGATFLLQSILAGTWTREQRMALVDGRDRLDPAGCRRETLTALLWVRCANAAQAIRATDLLLRDGNLPLIALDLADNPAKELRAIPATTWFRLQRIAEENGLACLVLTPGPLVASAHARLFLRRPLTLASLDAPNHALIAGLDFELVRQRRDAAGPHVALAG